jgi:hypothetical protein
MESHDDGGDPGRVAAVVDYFIDPTPALLPLVRGVGVLAVMYGAITLLMVPVEMAYRYQWFTTAGAPARSGFYRANEIVGVVFSIVSGIWLIVGGLGCLRRAAPRGRRVLMTWAWACLGIAGYGLVVNVWYMFIQAGVGRYTTTALIYAVGYQLRASISGVVLPFVVLVLFRQRPVREVFFAGEGRA